MAKQKLYQYLQGENRGKVVALTGIEAEENTTYLTFDDGNRCNVEFAAKLNDARAYSDGKFVAEVCDTKNIWTFEDKSLSDDVRWGQLRDTGEMVQGWDPYMHGQRGNENKAKNSTKAFPPRHVVTESELQAGSEKLKELGIDPNTPGYEAGMKNLTMPSQSLLQNQLNGAGRILNENGGNYENVEWEGTTMTLDPTGAKPPSAKDLEQYQRATEIYIPEDFNTSSSESVETNKTEIVLESKVNQTVSNILTQKEEVQHQKPNNIDTSSPIYSIVSKCKKKDVSAPLVLNLKLPGKSIYNLIKDEYEDDAVDEFFNIILNDINIDEIKASLKEALRKSYEPQSEE